MSGNAKTIAGAHVLNGLDKKSIDDLTAKCTFRDFKPGDTVIRKDEAKSEVYFVVSGQMAAFNYVDIFSQVFLTEYFPGDLFGELAAVDGGVRAAWVVAAEDSTVASLPGEDFLNAVVGNEGVTRNVLAHFSRIIRGTGTRVQNLSLLTTRQRVAVELIRLAGAESLDAGEAVIEHMPSHSALASFSSTSREIAGDVIGEFLRDGLVFQEGQSIRIKELKVLRHMVEQMDYRKLSSEEGVQTLFKEIYAD